MFYNSSTYMPAYFRELHSLVLVYAIIFLVE